MLCKATCQLLYDDCNPLQESVPHPHKSPHYPCSLLQWEISTGSNLQHKTKQTITTRLQNWTPQQQYFKCINNLKILLCSLDRTLCHLVHAQVFGHLPQYSTDTSQVQNPSPALVCFLHIAQCPAIYHLPTYKYFFSVFHKRKHFVKTYPLSACLGEATGHERRIHICQKKMYGFETTFGLSPVFILSI